MEDSLEEIEFIINCKDLIMQGIEQDRPYVYLNHADLLLKTLEKEYKKTYGLDKLERKIRNMLMNPTNNRILRLNQKVKEDPEASAELYDYLETPNDIKLNYNIKLEKDLMELQDLIKDFLAVLFKTKILESQMEL
jgi:hypothetical protein